MHPSHPPSSPEQVFRRRESVVYREIAGEGFLVPVEGDLAQMHKLFVLNEVAGHIWQLLDGCRDLAAIHHSLVEEFEVSDEEAESDLAQYVEALRGAGLVEEVVVDRGGGEPEGPGG